MFQWGGGGEILNSDPTREGVNSKQIFGKILQALLQESGKKKKKCRFQSINHFVVKEREKAVVVKNTPVSR